MVAVSAKALENGAGPNFTLAPITILAGDNAQLKADVFRAIRQMSGLESDDPFRFVNLDSDALERDPGLLVDELGAISMFGGSRLIRVFATARQCEGLLAQARVAPRGDWFLVVDTGDVSDSNWVGAVQSAREEMIVICSAEKPGDFRAFVLGEFSRSDLRIDDQAVEALIFLTGDDRTGVRGEIEKLALLHGATRDITIEDVRAVVADASSMLADEVAAATLSGDSVRSAATIDRLALSGSDPTQALNAALRHTLAIHRTLTRQWGNRSDGIGAAFSAVDARALTRSLLSSVLQTRSDGSIARLVAERSLVALSNSTRRRRRA